MLENVTKQNVKKEDQGGIAKSRMVANDSASRIEWTHHRISVGRGCFSHERLPIKERPQRHFDHPGLSRVRATEELNPGDKA